ncbi:YqhR family membrane protein [Bacillus solimangrovi]|uniref:Uncharacterized protein n=1 Tax=Bacillus solimangrovi TaxID=1305675 RepID=A0A1E5LKB6_9BACI|nr:YqhR family membrane protein [Bacillus solimangrovi]OEH94476.1 hypothetical protein BFG57_07310 [Bacillus solimangrovi]
MSHQETMSKSNEHLEQNKREVPMSRAARIASIGFSGGLIWSSVGFITYYFNFVEWNPSFVLEAITTGDWRAGVLGTFIGILFISIISIGVAFVYSFALKQVDNVFGGILFGLALWGAVFYLFNPLFPSVKPVSEWDFNSIVTSLCLYILYGVFVGYSISFDAKEMEEAQKAEVKENYSSE